MQIKIGEYLRCIVRGYSGTMDSKNKFHYDLIVGNLYKVIHIMISKNGEAQVINVQDVVTNIHIDNVDVKCFMKDCPDFEAKSMMKKMGYDIDS